MGGLPQRNLIHDQLVALLRDEILTSRWQKELPVESELCREFQVSRMTLRKVIAQLAAEKWVALGGRGRRHRITRKPRRHRVSSARTIRLLTPFSTMEFGSTEQALLDAVAHQVGAVGYRVVVECHPRLFKGFHPARLSRLDSLPDTAAWLLLFASEPIQRWFSACGRPVVLIGRPHGTLPLSSIYPDGEASARHAAGMLYAKGHREMVYLIANLTSIGDRLSADMFVSEARRLGGRARIVTHDASMESVTVTVNNLMVSSQRPTAFLVGAPEVAVTVLCQLLAAGVRVPGQVSLIANWSDQILNHTSPIIARYHTDGAALGRQLGRMLLDVIRHGTGKARSIPMIPEFVPGGSVGDHRPG